MEIEWKRNINNIALLKLYLKKCTLKTVVIVQWWVTLWYVLTLNELSFQVIGKAGQSTSFIVALAIRVLPATILHLILITVTRWHIVNPTVSTAIAWWDFLKYNKIEQRRNDSIIFFCSLLNFRLLFELFSVSSWYQFRSFCIILFQSALFGILALCFCFRCRAHLSDFLSLSLLVFFNFPHFTWLIIMSSVFTSLYFPSKRNASISLYGNISLTYSWNTYRWSAWLLCKLLRGLMIKKKRSRLNILLLLIIIIIKM